jgi:hypothetical protein
MSISGIRFEDRLDGASNFGIWKERILLSLEEYGLKEFAEKTIAVPTNAQQAEAHKKMMPRQGVSFWMGSRTIYSLTFQDWIQLGRCGEPSLNCTRIQTSTERWF